MTEATIEKAVCKYATERGWWPIKMGITYVKGFPDRMFLGPNGRVFFIEFKAPKKLPTKLQRYRLEQLKEMGFDVYVVDSTYNGKQIVEEKSIKNQTAQLSDPSGFVDPPES